MLTVLVKTIVSIASTSTNCEINFYYLLHSAMFIFSTVIY